MLEKYIKLWVGSPQGASPVVRLSQYDTDWKLIFTVYDGDALWEIPEGAEAILTGRNADGSVFAINGSVSGNTVEVSIADPATVCAGKTECELRFGDDDGIVGTANFTMEVEESPLSRYRMPTEDFDALNQLLNNALIASAEATEAAKAAVMAGSYHYYLAKQAADMTNTEYAYVYLGDPDVESGYTKGAWYYYSGSSWVMGGLATDDTLAVSGTAADAKVAGDKIEGLRLAVSNADGYEIVPMVKGYSVTTNYSARPLPLTPSASAGGMSYAIVDVVPGDTFSITGSGGSLAQLWCFIDSENYVVTHAPNNAELIDGVITAPANAAKLVVNVYPGGSVIKGRSLDSRVKKLEASASTTRNIFDADSALSGATGVTFADGVYSGKNTDFKTFILMQPGSFSEGDVYTLSLDMQTDLVGSRHDGLGFYIKDEDNVNVLRIVLSDATDGSYRHVSITFVMTADSYLVRFGDAVTTTDVYHLKNIQIERGYFETSYIPQETAVDYEAREAGVEMSKNLFNADSVHASVPSVTYEDGVFSGTAVDLSEITIAQAGQFISGETYTLTFEFMTVGSDARHDLNVRFLNSSDTQLSKNTPSNHMGFYRRFSLTFEASASLAKIKFGHNYADNPNVYKIKNIQLEKGSKSTGYAPYGFTAIDTQARSLEYFTNNNTIAVEQEKMFDGAIMRLDSVPASIPVDEDALGYEEFIAQTWDTFLTDYPDQVEKSVITTSSTTSTVTEEFDIYKYVFTPVRGYKKTVLLTAGVHGAEYEGFWGLYRLMRLIYGKGYKYPLLRNLKYDVRFVIIPSWNPWGVEHGERNCPMGFGAHHNLNEPVTVDDVEYPAFACNEAQAIKAVLDEYEGELSLWLDFHTDPYAGRWTEERGDTPNYGCYLFVQMYNAMNNALRSLTTDIRAMVRDETGYRATFYFPESGSHPYGHPAYGWYRGVPTAVVEVSTWMDDFPYASGSGEMMKLTEEWYANVLCHSLRSVK